MAKIEVIAELIRSIGLGNKKRARAIIENMVRYENESGKTGAGLKLQYALRTWGDACEMAELPQNAKQFVFDSQPQKKLTNKGAARFVFLPFRRLLSGYFCSQSKL